MSRVHHRVVARIKAEWSTNPRVYPLIVAYDLYIAMMLNTAWGEFANPLKNQVDHTNCANEENDGR